MIQLRSMVGVLVSVILIGGWTFTASADNLRRIVSFRPTTSILCSPLVKCLDLKTTEGMEKALAEVTATGSTVVHQLAFINALAIELSPIAGALTDLLNSLYVLEVVDDLLTKVDPICPTPGLQLTPEIHPWGLQHIDVPDAHEQWPEGHGLPGSGVTVAVLDTGIDWTHLTVGEFSGRDAGGYNALYGGVSYYDNHGHGTHMAGIIAAAVNNLGIKGIAPQVLLAAVKVLDQNGNGYVSDVINGLQWVSNNGIPLVNMSLGFSNDSPPLKQAIQELDKTGVIMVAAAGNRCAAAPTQDDGGGDYCEPAPVCTAPLTAVTYPAAYSSVIAVGATDIYNQVTAYSLSGPKLALVAPGGALESGAPDSGQVLSTNKDGGYGRGSGTSQAAAHVTGAVALALQLQPGLSLQDVRNVLQTTATQLTDPSTGLPYPKDKQGEGLINVYDMIQDFLP